MGERLPTPRRRARTRSITDGGSNGSGGTTPRTLQVRSEDICRASTRAGPRTHVLHQQQLEDKAVLFSNASAQQPPRLATSARRSSTFPLNGLHHTVTRNRYHGNHGHLPVNSAMAPCWNEPGQKRAETEAMTQTQARPKRRRTLSVAAEAKRGGAARCSARSTREDVSHGWRGDQNQTRQQRRKSSAAIAFCLPERGPELRRLGISPDAVTHGAAHREPLTVAGLPVPRAQLEPSCWITTWA